MHAYSAHIKSIVNYSYISSLNCTHSFVIMFFSSIFIDFIRWVCLKINQIINSHALFKYAFNLSQFHMGKSIQFIQWRKSGKNTKEWLRGAHEHTIPNAYVSFVRLFIHFHVQIAIEDKRPNRICEDPTYNGVSM